MRNPGKRPNKNDTSIDMVRDRHLTADFFRNRGTSQFPDPPRDLQVQSAPRGVFLTWSYPTVNFDIVGWRVYKNDENTLYHELMDPGVRKLFVEGTAATVSVKFNLFVSSLNGLGRESQKVQIQGAASNEAGAPVMPNVPPGYNTGNAGGGNLRFSRGRFNQE